MEPLPHVSQSGSEKQPGFSPDHAPVLPNLERRREQEVSHERPTTEELQQRVDAAILPPPVTLAPVVSTPAEDSDDSSVATSIPLIANDDDLIEKEWVEKAKQIISETKEDPYRREVEVGKLQADYLRKRYGKELGASQ